MNRKLLITSIFLIRVLIGTAQNPINDSIIENAASNNIKARLSSPFGASSLSNFFSNVSISSFYKEGVNGKIEVQGKFNSRWSGGITLDQKIGSMDTKAIPLSLSGISPGTTMELNLQKMFWHPTFNLNNAQIEALQDVSKTYARRNNISDSRTVGLREISLTGTDEEKKMALAAFNRVSFNEPIFINAKVGFTKTSFAYATDSFTLKENNDAFITPTVTVSLIKALGNGFIVNGYVALSYKYGETYTAADDVTFNIPFGRTGNTYANTLAFGKPEKTTSNNIIAEYRRNILIQNQNRNPSNIAISPSVNLDISNKLLGVFLPVYFICGADEKGKLLDALQGGIRFGYVTSTEAAQFSSFKNGFNAQLIISQPLDFLKNL